MMKIKDIIHGFCVTDASRIPALDAEMYLFEHTGCGAKLCFLHRKDASRTFSITFGTPPTDDTGVFHILEHSVLCGSDKFPTKEPFTELLKGSLNTFLNAMTYSDRTAYPVASRNDKDFYNLVDVYMDAVLHPKAVTDERIFRQEGWRHEIDESGAPAYNGVVYSEMKGVYSSADSIAAYHNARLLFPDGTYSYDSGGHPDAITSLTYEGFCAAHEKHYHPSGAYMFLDGEPNLDEILPLLDSYLKEYDRRDVELKIERGGDITTEPLYESYEIDEGESEEDKTRLYLTYVAGDYSDLVAQNALTALTGAIADTNEAPLKKAILSAGLCDNLYIYTSPGCKWSTLNVEFRDVKDGCEDRLIAHFDSCVRDLLAEGIDPALITAAIDRMEFKTREADFGSSPKGIIYLSAINDVWLYGMHPKAILDYEESFRALREAAGAGYPERLFEKILSSPRATLILKPSRTLGEERAAESEARLLSSIGEATEERLAELARGTEEFRIWQSTPDSDEALATIPTLTIDDLGDDPIETPTIVNNYSDSTLIDHPIATNGITYIDMLFDASDTAKEDIPLLALMSLTYPNLDTKMGSASYFRTRAKSTLGAISMSTAPIKRGEETKLYLTVRYSCLDSRRADALELAREYLYDTLLENTAAVRRAITQYSTVYADMITENGHAVATMRAAARHSGLEAMKEYTGGYELYRWLKTAKGYTDAELVGLTQRMSELRERIFVRERLVLSLTGATDVEYSRAIVDMTAHGTASGKSELGLLPECREGIAIPSQVSYAAVSGNLYNTRDGRYNGAWSTLSNLLDFEILWEEVRVKGGAYGVGFTARSNSGTVFMFSYRDPNPRRTLEVFRDTPTLIRERLAEGYDLTSLIIGTVGSLDPVTTPAMDGSAATILYLSDKSHADVVRNRRECIATTREKLIELSHTLDEVMEDATVVVVGPRDALEELGLDEILEI